MAHDLGKSLKSRCYAKFLLGLLFSDSFLGLPIVPKSEGNNEKNQVQNVPFTFHFPVSHLFPSHGTAKTLNFRSFTAFTQLSQLSPLLLLSPWRGELLQQPFLLPGTQPLGRLWYRKPQGTQDADTRKKKAKKEYRCKMAWWHGWKMVEDTLV